MEGSQVQNTTVAGVNVEPIAVIGFALKFPQQASTPAAFWDLLIRGGSARTEVPTDRYNAEAFYRAGGNGAKTGTIKTKHGHFIAESLDRFDAPFFSITPHEAECMDPQQRWLLESTYHALENAGLTLDHVNGSSTSVYVGCFMNDHETMVHKDLEMPNTYHATGNASAMLANRISWFYNLNGPSMSVNTACSGSLVALHLACQSLRARETTMGLVCGSNLLFSPESTAGLSNLNFLSPDGKCYSFDERANGYARGEGIVSLVIKPLSTAIQDGDTIRALIRGTGVNSDGRTPGITQPSSEAQVALIRETYRRFGLDPSLTRYFEAHGTGTAIGDPLEAKAIATVFKQRQRGRDSPMFVGALKSNIGHLEGASGLAGVIKAILVLENALIPPNIWLHRVNSAIKEEWGLIFPTKAVPFPGEGLRRASVNSFGFGGTNAHAVLDDTESFLKEQNFKESVQPRSRVSAGGNTSVQASKLLVWSAADEMGVKRLREAYSSHFLSRVCSEGEDIDAEYLGDLAYTLSRRRTHLPWRSFSICDSPKNLCNLDFAAATRMNSRLRVCYVFTGQGAQWTTMGQDLLSYDVFRQSIENSDATLRDMGCQFSIIEKLYGQCKTTQVTELDLPEFCQPICTALQIALVELLVHWRSKPFAVIGHSSGEIAAAYCAGVISKTYALSLAFFKGVAVGAASQMNSRRGGMMAVRMSPKKCEEMLSTLGVPPDSRQNALQVACYNSPQNVTLSGDKREIERLETLLQVEGIMAKKLNVAIAYHNAQHMQTAAGLYRTLIHDLPSNKADSKKLSSPQCFFLSSARGTCFEPESDASEISMPSYWVDNLISPVRFTEAMQSLASLLNIKDALSDTHFVEVGPHSTLKSAIKEALPKEWNVEQCYSPILSRQQPAMLTSLTMAGRLHCLGYPLDITAVNQVSLMSNGAQRILAGLPPYPFDRSKQYWLESRTSKNYRLRRFPHHDFLGTPSSNWNSLDAQWNNRIILQEKAFVRDHKVGGSCVYPAAGMLVMAIEAVRQLEISNGDPKGYRFKNVAFSRSLIVPETSQGVETQFRLCKNDELSNHLVTWYEFRLYMYEHSDWSQCCHGSVIVEYQAPDPDSHRRATEVHKRTSHFCQSPVVHGNFYSNLRNSGLDYGPLFQIVDRICYGDDDKGIGDIDIQRYLTLSRESPQSPCFLHPAALDCIFQTAFLGITQGGQIEIPILVPTGMKELWISADVPRRTHNESVVQVSAQSFPNGPRTHTVNYISLWKKDERLFLIGELTLTSIGSADAVVKKKEGPVSLYHIEWKPDINLFSPDSKYPVLANHEQPWPHNTENISLTEYACFLAMSDVVAAMDGEKLPHSERPIHLQKYLDWMRHELALMHGSDSWNDLDFMLPKGPGSREDLLRKVEAFGPEGKLIVRLSRVLLQIVRSEVNPLHVLFDDTLAEYYRLENPPPEVLSGIQKYVDYMAHVSPNLRVLEIGAGTGGMTKGILDILGGSLVSSNGEENERARFSEYMFTDISPAFFDAAIGKFNRDGFVCKAMNIEKGPEEQGFEMGSYDLIIASNVLHATRCLSSTLSNTRKLLKTNGKLILVEGISPNLIRTSFIFGCLPGWWLSTESFREWGPLVPVERWNQLLQENQFTGTELIIDGVDKSTTLSSAMISTAYEHRPDDEDIFSNSSLVVVRSEASALQHSLALSIQGAGKTFGLQVNITDADGFRDIGAPCVFLQTMNQFSFRCPREKEFDDLKKVFRNAKNLLWVTRRDSSSAGTLEQDAILGLSRSIISENEGLKIVTLGLEDVEDGQRATRHIWTVLHKYFKATCASPMHTHGEEIAEIDGLLCVSRLLPARKLEADIRMIQYQDKSLAFEQDTADNCIIDDGEIEIEVKAIGLRPQTLSRILGQATTSLFANDYAGVVTQVGQSARSLFQVGAGVIAVTHNHDRTFKARVQTPAYLVHKIPDGLNFAEAVAMPLDFMTAYDALTNWARLQTGESILIQDGCGALGQAAIQVALLAGAIIFVTVAKDEDVEFISALYKIPISHVLRHHRGDIAADMKQLSGGRGVNVVFNPLTSNGHYTSWESVAPYGRVIEVGDQDMYASSGGSLPVPQSLKKNIMFARVDLAELFQNRARVTTLLSIAMDMIESKKIVAPEPLHVYTASQIANAFRKEDSGMSSGKIVLSYDPRNDASSLTTPKLLPFHPNATYIITGGLGGLGKSIAKWMVTRGARNLLLLSRQGGETSAAEPFLNKLTASGVEVFAPKCDIGDEKAVNEVFREVQKCMPPIKGCIQASMVLKSAMFQKLPLEQWTDTLRSKVQGSLNLHQHLPANLDFLVLLSSICGIIGASGQSNYAFGCAYQDAMARYRLAVGQKAISIDLGIVEGVGYTAEHQGVASFMRSLGMQPISEEYLHALLEYYCDQGCRIQGSSEAQVIAGIMTEEEMHCTGIVRPRFYSRPLVRHLERLKLTVHAKTSQQKVVETVPTKFTPTTDSFGDQFQVKGSVSMAICRRLSDMLALSTIDIDPAKPLHAYGVDSLVAMEIRNWFKEEMGVDVAVFDILSNMSIDSLAGKIVDGKS